MKTGRTHTPPRLRTVLLVVHLLILCLPLAGIFLLRLYDSLLVRQTESELIVQGAALAAAHRAALRDAARVQGLDLDAYGRPIDAAWAGEPGAIEPFDPGIPGFDLAKHPILDDAEPAETPTSPPDALARAAGESLVGQLAELKRVSLAGIRVLDVDGVVVASTGTETGLSLAHRPEVASALEGKKVSLLRRRSHDGPRPDLDDRDRANFRSGGAHGDGA